MAKFELQFSGMEQLLAELAEAEVNIKPIVEDAMTQFAETVHDDTVDAVQKAKLPAKGRYSTGATQSAVANPDGQWVGKNFEVSLGFDYTKEGAGGWLITGTPRMRPATELHRMYKQKRYMNQLQKEAAEMVMDDFGDLLGG